MAGQPITERQEAAWYAESGWHWPGGGADHRLLQSIGQLAVGLTAEADGESDWPTARRRALELLQNAKRELDRPWAHNEEAWAWFHAARREALRLLTKADLALLDVDLTSEAAEKLKSWRKNAVAGYSNRDDDKPVEPKREDDVERIIRVQRHLDETAENDNRKRLLHRRQLVIYLAVLATVLVMICLLELLDRGLLLASDAMNGWWVVSAALYGTLGGAFSSAQRVAAAGPRGRYPELRWAQLANALRPVAGGAAALVAFAALQIGLLDEAVGQSGPRIAMFSFVAGFSERFIPSIAAQQDPQPTSPPSVG